jgi:hypothetical protein
VAHEQGGRGNQLKGDEVHDGSSGLSGARSVRIAARRRLTDITDFDTPALWKTTVSPAGDEVSGATAACARMQPVQRFRPHLHGASRSPTGR